MSIEDRTLEEQEAIEKQQAHTFDILERGQIVLDIPADRLREIAAAEREGRLIMPPCKVGDTIYVIPSEENYRMNMLYGNPRDNRVYKQVVERIEFYPLDVYLLRACNGVASAHSDFFGITWFLTREEAVAALAEKGVEHETV